MRRYDDGPSFEGLPRGSEFAQFVADHFGSDADRDVLLPVMDQEAHPVVARGVSFRSALDRIFTAGRENERICELTR